MSSVFESVASLLCCPEEGGGLEIRNDTLRCHECGRIYPLHSDNFVELLPSKPLSLPRSINEDYRSAYLTLFQETPRATDSATAWGAEESVESSWLRKRMRQVRAASEFVVANTDPAKSTLCDLSAGAGHYTFAYAPSFRWVLHCDLSISNLNYCRARAKHKHLTNIVFVRMDYFKPPFRASLERLICFDTIIRGEEHDRLLLANVMQSLKSGGRAVIDFHNWWHNPFRRVGLLQNNFISNKSYSRIEAESLLSNLGIRKVAYRPFHQEFDGWVSTVPLTKVFPPTRFIYAVEVGNSSQQA